MRLELGHFAIFDTGDSGIFVELRKIKAIKSSPTRMRFELSRAKPIGLDSPMP